MAGESDRVAGMSKFARMVDVLDLYSESVTLLSAEEVATQLQVSRPTAFRYMRELSSAGFLANYSGRYSLGARIITLDFRIRASDPLIKEASSVMHTLCKETSCGALLCRMYNEDIIHVHYEAGHNDPGLDFFGRGRPLPLFKGSASKIMLAFLPPAKLKKIYERHRDDPDVRAVGADWASFKSYFAAIRRTGHYVSNQEVNTGTVGLAAPIYVAKIGPVAVISLIFSVDRLPLLNTEGLAASLTLHTQKIAARLHRLAQDPAQPPETADHDQTAGARVDSVDG